MNDSEIKQILEWISEKENIKKLSFTDQLKLASAYDEFIETVKPIVIKGMMVDNTSTFIFKM